MQHLIPSPCIPDEGVEARIPGSPISVLTLVEARKRLSVDEQGSNATPDVLSKVLTLSLAQVHAALAYYHANQEVFDAEIRRRHEASEQALSELFAKHGNRNGWAEIWGKWPGDETDEEIAAALEELS